MEAGEETSGNVNLKRQRAPLSDSEDNVLSSSEVNDVQKRRRLEATGQENRSPKPSNSGRLVELGTKPDTPMVPSVRSRVQQLTQRREGAPLAQRCLSDPGAVSPSASIYDKGLKEHLLGEEEFNQRMERFKAPLVKAAPALSPLDLCPRTRSNFVSDIHQKLQGTTTPSSKEASRMRQEREQELNQLQFQPISENVWLKRSSSDPSLAQVDDAEMNDGSFTEASISGAEKPPVNTAGERPPCDSDAPAASVELESSSEGQLQMEWKNQNTHQGEGLVKEKDHKALFGNEEEQLGSQEPETQTVLKLSFSEDQSFSKTPFFEDQNVSGHEQILIESAHPHETETVEVSEVTEHSRSDVFSFEENETMDAFSYGEEEIEPSTDEKLLLWQYPQYKVCKEEESIMSEGQEEDVCAKEEEGKLESSRVDKESVGSDHSDILDSERYLGEIAGSSELQEDEKPRPDEDSVKDQSTLNRDQVNIESYEDCFEGAGKGDNDTFTIRQDQKDAEGYTHKDDMCQQSKDIQTINIKEDNMDVESNSTGPNSRMKQIEASHFADLAQTQKQTQTEYIDLQRNTEDEAPPQRGAYAEPVVMDTKAPALSLTEVQVSECLLDTDEAAQEAIDGRQGVIDGLTEETHKAEGGESLKKVTFVLEPELINDSSLSETSTSVESRAETSMSDTEMSSHDETNTSEIIDRMFEEVLEYAGRMEEGRGDDEDAEDHDSGIGACSGDKDKMDTVLEKGKREEEGEAKEEYDESNGDELLTFPPSGILSPLSKSVEAVVTPLRLAANQESNPPSLLLTPEETTTPPVESAPLYSVDAYRTQRQSKLPAIQSVTPRVQRRAPEKSQPQHSVNNKEKITALNEEAGKLQNVINQTLQALSCCTDEEHGRGSLEEAEAEKLLLVSCEKRSALLAEVSRLREERNLETGEAAGEDGEYVSQQPCRGTVSITNIQLPLKVEFVCSSHSRTGRPSHYFFVLIRYGPCNIIATPLATAADAQNGDTISFPTSVTLKDIRSSFEIDVEVYSLSHTSGSSSSVDRNTTKSRVTPRKLLSTITQRSNHSLTSAALPALNTRRSSNFCLVGSHKITLASLGHSKFPLDKVPFLSPLEGNIYLRLGSESHSNVHHQGFLTMFELISGYGVWHRRYFVLEGCSMYYWNHPNDKETKEAEGSISLSSSPSQCVRPVKRDSCARPFTFELVSNILHQQQDDSQEASAKCWFSADTKQERLDWMEKLNQVLLDFHTWNRTSVIQTESQQSHTLSSGNLRESIL
ncbi:anillin, actin binding protein 2 isoform X3 [Seriola aureovittata]|uniref:anillin, actin binding protein 2 isoform X3 n=1 Tax=Seriola aureovittata TaxID=2871759 RepID=UPI0024BDAAD2|nr:anillin, actin binding protein 2 isoform X3 [Seriola aureovittata]